MSPTIASLSAEPLAASAYAPPEQVTLDALQALAEEDLERVNVLILELADSHVARIPELARHLMRSGGKRLRPLLTLATARLCGYEGERHIRLAAAVECIHTATLLHDDVVDQSRLRRGLETANAVWGNKTSILVGDYVLSQAFKLMVADGSLEVLRILSDASAVIAEGEVLQLTTANNLATTEDIYLKVIEAKTAALFAAACEVSPVMAETTAFREGLRAYGYHLGVAFQIADDVLDYEADAKTLGKSPGDDFAEGKITLPIIYAYAEANAEERAFWQRVMVEQVQEADDFGQALQYLQRHGALKRASSLAMEHAQKARDALQVCPANPYRFALEDTAQFAVQRLY